MSARPEQRDHWPSPTRTLVGWVIVASVVLGIAFVGTRAAQAATPPVVATSVLQQGSAASFSVSNLSPTAGDLLLMQIVRDSTNNTTPPAGWTLLRTDSLPFSFQSIYYRVATGTEPATSTWSFATAADTIFHAMRVTGADSTTPIALHGAQNNTAIANLIAPSVNAPNADSLLLALYDSDDGNAGFNPPTAMTEIQDSKLGFVALYASRQTLAAAGATGTRTATPVTTRNHDSIGALVVINPPLGVPTPTPVPTATPDLLEADGGGPYSITEGSPLDLDATASTGTITTYRWDLDADGQYDDAIGAISEVDWKRLVDLGIDDNGGPFTIGLEVGDGITTATATTSVTITNTEPTITVRGPGVAGVGQTHTVEVTIDDPGDDTVTSWTINWGDGSISSGAGLPGTRTHTYGTGSRGMTRDIAVAVVDDDGEWIEGDLIVPAFDDPDTVARFDAESGTRLSDFAASGGALGAGRWATFGPDGLVYVSSFDSDRIVRYDPSNGSFVGTFVTAGSGGLDGPKGITFGPNGNLFVASANTAVIEQYNGTTGAPIANFASTGLTSPSAVVFGPDGSLFVSDQTNDNIRRFHGATGTSLGVFATVAAGGTPGDLTFGPDGHVYVSLYAAGRVDRFNGTTGALMGTFASAGLANPTTLAFGPDGDLWVGAYGTDSVRRYDGITGATLGVRISQPAPFGPMDLVFEPDRRVAVVDSLVVNSIGDGADAASGNGVCETSTAGECTLRAAINEANATSGAHRISFAIPGAGPSWTISPTTMLPPSLARTVIDATTQSGYAGAPVVRLDGAAAPGATGLQLFTAVSEIRGLAVTGFAGAGIEVRGNSSVIAQNRIGLGTGAGDTDLGNVGGLTIVAADDVTVIDNVLSGNDADAILVNDGSDRVVIEDNLFGTNAAGTALIANTQEAIQFGNVTSPRIVGNTLVGGSQGIGSYGTLTGGTIQGNVFGRTPDGATLLGPQSQGILLGGTPTDVLVGGVGSGDGNVISATFQGIFLPGSADDVAVVGNEIFDTGMVGIDLGSGGSTANDANDADTGANDLINHPVITSATAATGTVTIKFNLDVPAGSYRVEAFTNPTSVAPADEGEVYENAQVITHTGGGSQSFQLVFSGVVGDRVALTTTEDLSGSYGSSSEFSDMATVTSTATNVVVVNSTANGADVSIGNGVCQTAVAGQCTLRAAIAEADASASIDTIDFAIATSDPGHSSGVWTIAPTSVLPAMTTAVTLDATTQPGWTSTPVVVLDGVSAGGASGLVASGPDVTIRGFAIGRFDNGVAASGARVVIERNHLGTDATGTTALPNVYNGASITGVDATITENLLSGNTANGIILTGGDAARVVDNLIGVNVTGNTALANNQEGIEITNSDNVVVGEPGLGNVISGNGYAAVNGYFAASNAVVIQGNLIGVGADGTTPLGNSTLLAEGGISVRSPSSGWLIGGDAPGEGNLIANNSGDGVQLWNGFGAPTDIAIVGNDLSDNTGLGIDLTDDGVTANDSGDGDGGANALLNFPVVNSAEVTGGSVTVGYALDVPAGTYLVEFFNNPGGADPTGFGEGELSTDTHIVTSTGSGPQSFSHGFAGATGDVITATTTRCTTGTCTAFTATSEFAAARTAVTTPTISGTVYEDVDGDGAVLDDGVGVGGVQVWVFRDQGNGYPDAGDAIADTTVTNSSGSWSVTLRSDGTFWSAVDSADLDPAAAFNAGSTLADVWADQTYAAAGAVGYNGSFSYSASPGAFFGGKRAAVADGFPSLDDAEHIQRSVVSGADVFGVDTGFSFAAITNTSDSTAAGAFASTSSWAAFDAGSNGVGVDPDGYQGVTYDGRYLYFSPTYNGVDQHGEVLRYDTQGPFSAATSWSAFDPGANGVGTDPDGYQGDPVFDGRYLYFSPYHNGTAPSGEVLRYDTQATFSAAGSWSTFDPSTAGLGAGARGFRGMAFDGRYAYWVPATGASVHGNVLRFDTTASFSTIGSWSLFDPGANGVGVDPDGYSGAVWDGRYLYLAPNDNGTSAHGEVLRYDSSSAFNSASAWSTFDPGANGVGADADGYQGIAFDGRYLYFSPFFNGSAHTGEVLRYDTQATFAVATSWTAFDAGSNGVGSDPDGYIGKPTFDGRYVHFSPYYNGTSYHGEVLRYDTRGSFTTSGSWAAYDAGLNGVGTSPGGFGGTTFDGRYVYYSPAYDSPLDGEVLRYDTARAGQGSLRQFVRNANAMTGVQTSSFVIPVSDPGFSAGSFTITPTAPIVDITDPITIDGTTQPGSGGVPVIRIVGAAAGGGADGLTLASGSSGSEVRGLTISGFANDGLRIDYGSTANTIVGNRIGTDVAGLVDAGNGTAGIVVLTDDNTIGGSTAADRNVISGNDGYGIYVAATSGNQITGNFIGVDSTGNAGLGNTFNGIYLGGGAANTVGGAGGGAGNVIGDNGDIAVRMEGGTNHQILGNRIGVGVDGVSNVGNLVGVSARYGTTSVDIGGVLPGEGNTIVNNGRGVVIDDPSSADISVLGNTIDANITLGIDLASDGVTANDAGDTDSGPNDLLNYPEISDVEENAGTVTVTFDLDVAAGDYRIEAFTNAGGADPSGFGEGAVFVTAAVINHTGSGPETFQLSYAGSFGDIVTLTATEVQAFGVFASTSEFSAAITTSCLDTDGDDLCDTFELPYGDTDGDSITNPDDPDDDGDTLPTSTENADPNGDGDPRDGVDADSDGQADWLDLPTTPATTQIGGFGKISDLVGGLTATLDDTDQFGRGMAAIGDLDLDGVVDIAVGAIQDDDGGTNRGAVHILFLNPDGTVRDEQKISSTQGGLTATIDNNDQFGFSVDGIDDLDGDGLSEIAVGAPFDDDGGTNRGAVHILFLNPDGTVRDEQKVSSTQGGLTATIDDTDQFSSAVAALGDLDGDGTPDLVVGAAQDDDGGFNRGAVHIVFLNPDGTVRDEQKISSTQGGLPGIIANTDKFGSAIADIGDVDGDGVADLAIGAPAHDDGGTDRGAVHIVFLNSDGTVTGAQEISDTLGGLTFGLADSDQFGAAATRLGDLDGDGRAELMVGAPLDNGPGVDRGAAHILYLAADGTVRNEVNFTDTANTLDDNDQSALPVAGLGDLDGDGSPDFATGARLDDDGGTDRGAVYLGFFEPVVELTVNSTTDAADAVPGNGRCDTGADNSQGDPECTLRAAIAEANNHDLIDTIHFDIPTTEGGFTPGSPDSWSIQPTGSALPAFSAPVDLDATTQPLWAGEPLIVLDGALYTGADDGLDMGADDSMVRGLSVINWPNDAIAVDGDDVVIAANWFAGAGIALAGQAADTVVSANRFTNIPDAAIAQTDDATGTVVTANIFGLDGAGNPAPVGRAVWFGATGTMTFGGDTPAEGNEVRHAVDEGIATDPASTGTITVLGNAITDSGGLAIDLADNGVTNNDTGDADAGSNGLLNFPVITAASVSGGEVTLEIDLDVPAGDYRIEVFSNPTGGDASAHGEAAVFLDAFSATHSGIGVEQLTVVFPGHAIDLAATITQEFGGGVFGATSELSQTVTVTGQGAVLVNSTGDAVDAEIGDGLCDTGSVIGTGYPECTLRAAMAEANALAIIDTINFAIPTADAGHAGGVWTILPATELPPISEGIYIDARTQPGWVDEPVIVLDGSTIGGLSGDGITLWSSAGGVKLIALGIIAFPDDGITVTSDDLVLSDVVIAGNGTEGIALSNADAVLITDSEIKDHAAAAGLVITGTSTDVVVTGSTFTNNNSAIWSNTSGIATIGGPLPATANVFTTSTWAAINHVGTGTLSILGNQFVANGLLGIDLGNDDVTPNDGGDIDAGPNELLNFPEIQSARALAGSVTADVTLDVPAGDYRVEIFANPSGADPSGFGEGELLVSTDTISHTGGGAESFEFVFAGAVDDLISMTLTADLGAGLFGATSEFSQTFTVTPASTAVVNSTGDGADAVVGDDRCETGTLNSNGDPECTLRAAITEANASVAITSVAFAIPTTEPGYAAGTFTIGVNAALPPVATTMTIDATTQPQWVSAATPVVLVDGSALTGTENGIEVSGGNVTVLGLAVGGFPLHGVRALAGATNFTLRSSWIGLDATGAAALENGGAGVSISSGASGSSIGSVGEGNVLSGNGAAGIDSAAAGVSIRGNIIGLDSTGSAALPNGSHGISVTGAATTIGGPAANEGNTISGNGGTGIVTTADTVVHGNRIGTSLNGLAALGNTGDGIAVLLGSTGSTVEGNTITANTGAGVDVATGPGNPAATTIVDNSIYDNGGLGIDVGGPAITLNDSPDLDGVPNRPEITAVQRIGNDLVVSFELDAVAGDHLIQFFGNTSADPTGSGEGEFALGTTAVTHSGAGVESFTATIAADATILSATATRDLGGGALGATSEFSLAVNSPDLVIVNSTTDNPDDKISDGRCGTGFAIAGGAPECTLRAAIEEANDATTPVDTIWFDIPPGDPGHVSGVWTITPGSELPQVVDTVTIDASTQPGWVLDPVVVLDGSALVGSGNGFYVASPAFDTSIGHLAVVSFPGDGFQLHADRVIAHDLFVGVLPDGITAAGNATEGIIVLGDDIAVRDNLIGGHANAAIALNGTSSGTIVTGNIVGTDRSGTVDLGNLQGVWTDTTAGAMVGGPDPASANVFANNGADAVEIRSSGSSVSVLGNEIRNSGGLGIDLAGDGVTANDSGDGDAGPNDLLNLPELDSAVTYGLVLEVDYALDVPAGDYRVEFFANPAGANPSGYGEAEQFLAAATVSHPGGGLVPFRYSVPGSVGSIVTATVTEITGPGAFGPTSELSQAVTAVDASLLAVLDSSARRSDLVRSGASVASTGVTGRAVTMTGTQERLVGPALDIADNALTMAGWIELTAVGADPRVLSRRGAAGILAELAVDSSTSEATARLRVGGGIVEARGGSVGTGAPHHLAAVWDGVELALFVDGVEADRVAAGGSLATDLTAPLIVGGGLIGRIDHATILHRAETADAIATHVANVLDPAGFVAVGSEQTGVAEAWVTSSAQARSGGFSAAAPQVDGPGETAWLTAIGLDEPGMVFRSWWWVSDTGVDIAAGTRTGAVPTDQYESALSSAMGWNLAQRIGATTVQDAPPTGTPVTGTWVQVEIWTDQLGNSRVLVDGTEVIGWTPQGSALTSGSVGLRAGNLPIGSAWYIDDTRGRRLITPEPITSLGPLDRD